MSLQMAGHVPRIGRGQGMKKSGYVENTRYEGLHYLSQVCALDKSVLHCDPTYVTMPNPMGVLGHIYVVEIFNI